MLLQSSTADLSVLLLILEVDLLLWPLLANELSVLMLLFQEVNMLSLLAEVNELLLLLKNEATNLYQGLAAGRMLLQPTMRQTKMAYNATNENASNGNLVNVPHNWLDAIMDYYWACFE